jgi:hypothetical protein
MAGKTNYLEGALMNAVLRNTTYTSPATVYVALFTAAPSDAYTSGSPDGTEVTGNAYARQSASFAAPSGTPRVCTNTGTITFPTATPGAWGTVTHFGIFDAVTTGNLLYWNALTASKTINAGDTAQFAASALTVQED